MLFYIIQNALRGGQYVDRHDENGVIWCIPFDPANTDYQQFKIQVADGTPLEDPEGNVMTQDEVDAFLKIIP